MIIWHINVIFIIAEAVSKYKKLIILLRRIKLCIYWINLYDRWNVMLMNMLVNGKVMLYYRVWY